MVREEKQDAGAEKAVERRGCQGSIRVSEGRGEGGGGVVCIWVEGEGGVVMVVVVGGRVNVGVEGMLFIITGHKR